MAILLYLIIGIVIASLALKKSSFSFIIGFICLAFFLPIGLELLSGLNDSGDSFVFVIVLIFGLFFTIVPFSFFFIHFNIFKKNNSKTSSTKTNANSKQVNEWVHKILSNKNIMAEVAQFSTNQNVTILNYKSKAREVGRFWGATVKKYYPQFPIKIGEKVATKLTRVFWKNEDINKVAPINKSSAKELKFVPAVLDKDEIQDGTVVEIKKVGAYIKAFNRKGNNLTKLISPKTRKNAFAKNMNLKLKKDSQGYNRWILIDKDIKHSVSKKKPRKVKPKESAIANVATTEIEDHILKLSELKDKGILTEEEFQTKKKELLDRI